MKSRVKLNTKVRRKEKKPHHMAYRAEQPCKQCGSIWRRPTIVLCYEAEELPIINVCARCGAA